MKTSEKSEVFCLHTFINMLLLWLRSRFLDLPHTRKLVRNERGDVLMGQRPEFHPEPWSFDIDCTCDRCMEVTRELVRTNNVPNYGPSVPDARNTDPAPNKPIVEPRAVSSVSKLKPWQVWDNFREWLEGAWFPILAVVFVGFWGVVFFQSFT